MLRSALYLPALILICAGLAFGQTGRAGQYPSDDVKTLRGTITNVDRPVATFKAEDGHEYRLHMGPIWFWEREGYSLRKDASATIKGEVEDIKGSLHLYPREIVQEGRTVTLADDDGVPEWAGTRGGRVGSHGRARGSSYRHSRWETCDCCWR